MNLTDAVDFEYPENEMIKPLKNITLSEADSTETFKFKPFEYERGAVTKTAKGVINTIRDMQDLPEQVKIFGKRISFGFGGYFGDTEEETERKKLNLVTAERNLNEAQAERYKYTSGREAESLAYGVGGGIVNYGTMLLPAGAVGGALKVAGKTAKAVKGAEAAGLTTMGVMELAGQVQDKTPMKDGEIDVEAMTPEWARKATGGTIAYTGISAVTEKYVGFGQQVRMWSKPIQWGGNITSKALTTLKTAGKNALSEGMTEGIQDLEATGIGLIDGTLTIDKLPARLQQAWKSAIIGSIIGGGVGTAAAIKSARNVKKQLSEMVAPVVGEEDASTVAEAIYDAGTDDMTKAISIELELSSELKNKHGKVWNSMLAAVSREIEGKPRFMAMTEDERASYANTVAKHFADQVLAEANYRGTTLDAILSASDIVYDNGIKLKRHINLYDALKNPEMIPPETKLKRESLLAFLKRKGGLKDYSGELKARDAQKLYPGLVSNKGMNFDDAALMAWEHGYFTGQERPDINEFLEAVDESLRGNHRYNVEEESTFTNALDDLEQELDRMGIDWKNMTAAEIEKAVNEIPEMESLQREAEFYANYEPIIGMDEDEAERFAIETEGKEYPVIDEKDLPERYYQIADENAQLDAENPAYDGETININGKERTVYNSDGERIAQSEAALRNFYNWFGDSKVVDKQGRPLVVYHGTNAEFDAFNLGKNGYFFTPDLDNAQIYANEAQFEKGGKKIVMPVYLNTKKPKELYSYDELRNIDVLGLKKQGYDGAYYKSETQPIYVAFESNQIKSTQNRGTYSESENIYYQEGDNDIEKLQQELKDWQEQLEKDKENPYNLNERVVENNIKFDKKEIARIKKQIKELEKSSVEPLSEKLYATHNMSLAGVRDALKLGGLAMPSLAMRKVSQGDINQFGDIVFVANERLATPSRTNEVYDRDAWTPNLSSAIKYDLSPEANTFIKQVLEKVGQPLRASTFRYYIEENLGFPQSDTMAQELYELDKGLDDSKFRGNEQEYLDWYNEHFMANTEPYLWTENASNTDMVRKKFTLDNMMKILRKQEKSGGGFIGDFIFDVYKLLNFRSQKFKNLKEIKKNRHKLVSREEAQKGLDKLNEDFLALAEELKKEGEDYSFGDATYGLGVALVQDTDKEIVRWLDYKNLQSDEQAIKKVKDFIERMKDIPTDYFEVKPRRVVDFSEFSGVIIPEGAQYDEVARILKKQHFLNVERVEKGNEAQYEQALNNIQANASTTFFQRGKNAKGYTNITPDEYIIKLLEGADESTLPHEFAHYWLTEMWNYTRTGRASEKYMKRWQIISDYLGIKPEQTRLARGQQEKFASSYEAYLTRGELPTPLIGSAFDDYDKWLQRVYSDYNRINYQSGFGKRRVRLTDAAIKFFQSMTTGTLEAPALAPKNTGVEVPQTVSAEEVIEPTNEIIETPTTYDTTRVINITEGEKGVSKVFQREAMKHADRIVDELGVSYNKINLEEQAIKAAEWVQNNLDEAREVVNGKAAPEGIIDTAIFIAYENEMLRIGNNAEYQRALKIHSQVQTQRGQAIAAERISTDDVYNPAYWWKKLQKNKETDVARKLFKGDTEALNKMIETETKSIMKQIAGKPKGEQVEALTKLAEKLQKDYKLDTLYQMPDDVNERTVREFIKDTIGVNPDVMAGNEVINKAEQLQKLWENTKDSSGNPSVEAMRAKRELNDLIQAQTPSNALAIWTSIFGRGIMLTSVKSPVLNIISNIEAGFTEGITRRLMYGTTEKAVDKTVKEEFSKYAWEVYKASADIVTTMNDYDDDMRIIGEQILHSQGPGAFRAASRKVEEVSFKYLMGAPDAVAKTLAFNDTADLLATKIAKEEGAKDISKRATEIYKDAILIKPETEVGQKIREQAQAQAHYTTFTNDSWAARFGLSARNWLNMVGRNKIRLGDLTMKFVKTPANVQMMGLEYGFGSLYTLYNVQEIIKNPQSETSQIAIRAAVRNGLGIALAALLYSMLDPDDYFSEFDTLNPKEKDRMRAMGAMPNSIKIGNKWVSLDYFGQLGIPLVGMLEARRNNGLRSYIQSGLTQAAKIPGIKETKQLIDSMSEYARYDLKPEKIAQMMAGTVLDQARAMTIPAIVNDIAKMTDDYERDTMGGIMDKVISSIPGLRQTLPERYGIQGLVRTEPALSTLLFGSRVKTEQSDKLVREVEKLAGKDEQPSISDVTKYGDLRLLSPEKKVKVRKEFYKAYNAESKKLISTREYQKKSPEDKKKALNKVRSRVVKSLKEKYNNDIQREKRRR